MSGPSERYFVSVQPGLESALEDELDELGVACVVEEGGVTVKADRDVLHHISLWSRVASRVTVRIGSFQAVNLGLFAAGVRKLPWARYVAPGRKITVRVTAHKSRLRHRETITKKLQMAVRDALRGPRSHTKRPPREPLLVVVRIVHDQVSVSVDASGESLHRRGWRREGGAAPLRENLAAGVLRLLEWDVDEALIDPMCGSGTFPIEAACIASGKPPGRDRPFEFETWPSHLPKAWAHAKRQASQVSVPRHDLPIVGRDRDEAAVRRSIANSRRAGVDKKVDWSQVVFKDGSSLPERSGLIVMNPPYGKRIERGNAKDVFASMGRCLRSRWLGWRVGILVPDRRLMASLKLPLEEVANFQHGGLRIYLMAGVVSEE